MVHYLSNGILGKQFSKSNARIIPLVIWYKSYYQQYCTNITIINNEAGNTEKSPSNIALL